MRVAPLLFSAGCLWIGPREQAEREGQGEAVARGPIDLRVEPGPQVALCTAGELVQRDATVDADWAGQAFAVWVEGDGVARFDGPTVTAGAASGGRAPLSFAIPAQLLADAAGSCEGACEVTLLVGVDHAAASDQAPAPVDVIPESSPILADAALVSGGVATPLDAAVRDPDDGFDVSVYPSLAAGVLDANAAGAQVAWLACPEGISPPDPACASFPATAAAAGAVGGDAGWVMDTADLAELTCGDAPGARYSVHLAFEGHVCAGAPIVEVWPADRWLGPDCDADGDPRGSDCADLDPAQAAGNDDPCGDGIDTDCDPLRESATLVIGGVTTFHPTLADAVAAGQGQPGAVVRLCAGGTWDGGASVTDDLVIEGDGGVATILGDGTGPVLSVGTDPTAMAPPPAIAVTLSNLVLTGGGGDDGAGLTAKLESLVLSDVEITANAATGLGGGALLGGTATLVRVDVHDNSAAEGGGIAAIAAELSGEALTVTANSASVVAGGVLLRDSSLTGSSTLGGNDAPVASGALLEWIMPPVAELVLEGAALDANTGSSGLVVRNDDSGGGALAVRDVTVTGHLGPPDGAGIFASGASGTLVLENVVATGNGAARGGGLYTEAAAVTIRGGSFSTNNAVEAGGGIYVGGGTVELLDMADVLENTSADGAGIAVSVGEVILTSTGIRDNDATDAGGGLWLSNAATVWFAGDVIAGNTAPLGAGVWVSDTSELTTCGASALADLVENADGSAAGIAAGTCTETSGTGPVGSPVACACP